MTGPGSPARDERPPAGAGGPVLARRSASFPPEPGSPGAARRLLRGALEEAGRQDWEDGAALALSEVVTNAALHAHTDIEVHVEVRAAQLLVEVRDASPALPLQRSYDEQATTGRGMALVAAVSDECGVHSLGADGKIVWFTLGAAGDEQSEDELLAAWDLDGRLERPAAGSGTRPIVLDGLPPTLWLAARQHHDALLRELVLHLAEHHDEQVDLALADGARTPLTAAVLAAVEQAQEAGTAGPSVPPGHPAPLPPVPDSLTLTVQVPVGAAPAYRALVHALDVAERLAATGRLLVRPGQPEIIAVRQWVCEQVLGQLDDRPCSRWPGTGRIDFEIVPAEGWVAEPRTTALVRESDRGLVAADETNRIVAISRPLADLLGWRPEELVGRRVVTLVPPRLREAHVAGFTRHLTTGEAHVLGVPLALPVLHRDGHEVAWRFLVERATGAGGRAVYLAHIDPERTPQV